MEGALAGIPSIALSQVHSREAMGDGMPFDAAAAWGERVLKRLIGAPWSPRTLVNINFPALPADEVKGVKVVDQGLRDYGRLRIIKGTDHRGNDYYWFGLAEAASTPGTHPHSEAVQAGLLPCSTGERLGRKRGGK